MQIEPGTYRAKAVQWQLCNTKDGKPQIAVFFQIANANTDEAPRRLTWYGFFTEKTTERTLESLRACGWSGEHLGDLRGMGSREVEIVVDYETGLDGKERARVQWVNAMRQLSVRNPMNADQVKALSQLVAPTLAKMKPAPAARPAASDDDDDFGPENYDR